MWAAPFDLLDKVLWNLVQGPHERSVKKYLNEATQESVVKDFQETLNSRSSYVWYLTSAFDTHAYGPDKKYWDEQSLRKYIDSSHRGLITSDTSLLLLWRCFRFYAFYPFPPDITNSTVDYDAFKRAVILLGVQGCDMVGMVDDGGWHWRSDDGYIPRTNLQRMLRSVGHIESIDEKDCQIEAGFNPIIDETMDVLKTTAPFRMHCGPWADQLDPVARRLLGESTKTQSQVSWEEFSDLLSLVLRLRLLDTKRAFGLHFGEFGGPAPAKETAKKIVDGLREGLVGDNITMKYYDKILEVLPDLHDQFHQFWAVLFQPQM
ncbi:uncharacterized protein N7511_002740 [Penicillium nucicola]|uniref:uncharacterized protein n=1 Tax=Penicillium nucicola TaxID=1850975 RepID=UPI002544DE92|nr:uncharacterized protein N7511_002740 [Penicillium nucicola]KAJ5770689.1 hypothetical protein N7511_002740 [Penicillium nucicola]